MLNTLAPHITSRYLAKTTPLIRDMTIIILGTFFTAALAQMRIPLPFTPVPITGQTFAVLLVGAALGAKRGFSSIMLYLALGAIGLPFYAGGESGWAYLSGPTLGYLVGFAAAAYVTGKFAEKGFDRSLRISVLPFLAGTVIIYLFGAGWLALSLGWQKALLLGVVPFLIGDLIKLALAAIALPAAWKLVSKHP